MINKLDILIPICRKDLQDVNKIKKRFDLLEQINDIDGINYIIIGTYSYPQITEKEIRKIIPSKFFNIAIIKNEDFEYIAKECGFKDLNHYYQITSVILEWIIRNNKILQTGEIFHWFHINDMIPFSLKWAQGLYKSWCDIGHPYICGEYWHGNPSAGHGPSMGDIFSWKWKDIDRKFGGWGAYDRELLYIAFDKHLHVFPTNSSATLEFLRFLYRDHAFQRNMPQDDYSWIDKYFGGYVSIIHDKSEEIFNRISTLISKAIEENFQDRLINFNIENNKNWIFDACIYINLKKRIDKLDYIKKQLDNAGIKAQQFPAIEPETNNGFHSKGAYGCLLSHWNIIQNLNDTNIGSCLIFEDDAKFDPLFKHKIHDIIQELPDDWGILYFWRDGWDDNECVSSTTNLYRIRKTNCTHAYAIHQRAYKPILDTIKSYLQDKKNYPIDNIFNHLTSSLKIIAYCSKLNIVHQEQQLLSSDIKI